LAARVRCTSGGGRACDVEFAARCAYSSPCRDWIRCTHGSGVPRAALCGLTGVVSEAGHAGYVRTSDAAAARDDRRVGGGHYVVPANSALPGVRHASGIAWILRSSRSSRSSRWATRGGIGACGVLGIGSAVCWIIGLSHDIRSAEDGRCREDAAADEAPEADGVHLQMVGTLTLGRDGFCGWRSLDWQYVGG
jgi:hypothetical protein